MSSLHLKPVPNPPDSLNILGLGRIKFNLLPYLLDMHRYSSNIANGFHIPDLTEQFLLGKHMVRILGQEGEQVKFLGGKCLLLPINPYAACRLINLQSTDLDDFIGRLAAADQPLISGP